MKIDNNFSADTIVISTRKKEDLNQKYQESQTNLFEELGLKLMRIPNIDIGKANAESQKEMQNEGKGSGDGQNKGQEGQTTTAYNSINNTSKDKLLSAKKKSQAIQNSMKKGVMDDKQNEFEINFDIEHIKKNYIFPFNQTTLRSKLFFNHFFIIFKYKH